MADVPPEEGADAESISLYRVMTVPYVRWLQPVLARDTPVPGSVTKKLARFRHKSYCY